MSDLAGKHFKITQLSAAIVRLQRQPKRTAEDALSLQHLVNQRRELMALMPPLRLVKGGRYGQ